MTTKTSSQSKTTEPPHVEKMRKSRDQGRFHALVQKEVMGMPLTEEERGFITKFKQY